jgi:hypothetical protein
MATTTITSTTREDLATKVRIGASSSNPELATGGYPFPGMPKFEDKYREREWQLEHMAGAFRVFARKGYTEGSAGHISFRDPVDPSTFWINP